MLFFFRTFAPRNEKINREVAQLVAHHVRDVGVGRSSRLFSTKRSSLNRDTLDKRSLHGSFLRMIGQHIHKIMNNNFPEIKQVLRVEKDETFHILHD